MGLGNIFLLSQVTILLMEFILSFLITVPVGVNLTEFGGHCLLFATGKWTAQGNTFLESVDWGPGEACNVTVFTGVAVMLVSLFYLIRYSVLLFRSAGSSWLDVFLSAFLSIILLVFSFASALTVSIGFSKWCSLVTDPKGTIDSCEDGDFIPFGEKIGINTRHFYTEFWIAEFGTWSVWICQLSLTILSIIQLYRYHRQEAFSVSINRERQHILQQVHSQSYTEAMPV